MQSMVIITKLIITIADCHCCYTVHDQLINLVLSSSEVRSTHFKPFVRVSVTGTLRFVSHRSLQLLGLRMATGGSVEWVIDDSLAANEAPVFEALSTSLRWKVGKGRTPQCDDVQVSSDGPAYYGDLSVVEDLVEPVRAFEVFAGQQFARNQGLDFEGDIYRESLATRNLELTSALRPCKDNTTALLPIESKGERLERLRAEIEYLNDSAQTLYKDNENENDCSLQLSEIREAIERMGHRSHPPTSGRAVEGPTTDTWSESRRIAGDGTCASTRQWAGNEDYRLAKLEASVGSGARANPRGLWGLVGAVHAQLEVIDQSSLRDVCTTVEELADVMDKRPQLSEVADTAELLCRLESIEIDAAGVPTLAARLRSLNYSLGDAGAMMAAVGDLNVKFQALESEHKENRLLLKKVGENVATNMELMERNIEKLEKRLVGALGSIES